MKKYKLAMLSGPLFSNNMGCNALTYGSIEVLSEVASKLEVEFEYCLLGNPETGVVPEELQSYNIQFIERLPDTSVRGVLGGIYRRTYQTLKHQVETLKDIDIFLDNSWGDSFSDIYGLGRFNLMLRHFEFAFKLNKPLVLLPQTIGPFKSEEVRKKAGEVLKRADAVYARDPLSVQCAQETCPDVEVFETIDAALFMNFNKRDVEKKNRIVGINPSGLLWRGGYTGQNQFGLKEDYPAMIRSIITCLLSMDGVSVEFIGHDIKGPNAGDTDDDYYICKILQKEFPQCKVAPFFYSPIEAKSYISGLDLLIGSRMHCCIAAYSSGIPVFPLAYSRKFKGLFADKLDYNHLSELDKDDADAVLSKLIILLDQLGKVNTEFIERLKTLETYKKELVDHLASKLGGLLGN